MAKETAEKEVFVTSLSTKRTYKLDATSEKLFNQPFKRLFSLSLLRRKLIRRIAAEVLNAHRLWDCESADI